MQHEVSERFFKASLGLVDTSCLDYTRGLYKLDTYRPRSGCFQAPRCKHIIWSSHIVIENYMPFNPPCTSDLF